MDLINPFRFDLIAKYLYIRYYLGELPSAFYLDLYQAHIITFNKAWEHPGTKKNIIDFINSFNTLINSIKNNGYHKNSIIEVNSKNIIHNGAHRLMICAYLGIMPPIHKINKNSNSNYPYDFFLHRNNYWRRDDEKYDNLDVKYTDAMALEYLRIKKNVRTLILYPISYDQNHQNKILDIIPRYGNLYYHKTINLNKNGIQNLIKEAYRGENWIGGLFPNDKCSEKVNLCYLDRPTELYLIDFNFSEEVIHFKEQCRKLYNLGKHSLHISDGLNDSFRIASALLNQNSLDFLNLGNPIISPANQKLLESYFNITHTEKEHFCLTSSIVLEMFHLRTAQDLDYLHVNNKKLKLALIQPHSGKWEKYYGIPKNEIIYNPENHFYFNGYKFASLSIIKKMKYLRNEEKDKKDIQLIDSI